MSDKNFAELLAEAAKELTKATTEQILKAKQGGVYDNVINDAHDNERESEEATYNPLHQHNNVNNIK